MDDADSLRPFAEQAAATLGIPADQPMTPEEAEAFKVKFEQLMADDDYVRKHRIRLLPPGKLEPVTHIAGVPVTVDSRLRQLCSWCGTRLVDYDLRRIAVPEGQDPIPGTWGVGLLVEVNGPVSFIVEHEDGADLPDNACACTNDQERHDRQ